MERGVIRNFQTCVDNIDYFFLGFAAARLTIECMMDTYMVCFEWQEFDDGSKFVEISRIIRVMLCVHSFLIFSIRWIHNVLNV
jgi:hypothetical protein